ERPAEEVLDPQQVQQVERDSEHDAVSAARPAASAVQHQAEAGECERSQPPEISRGMAEVQQPSPRDGERQAYEYDLPTASGACDATGGGGWLVAVGADPGAVIGLLVSGHSTCSLP